MRSKHTQSYREDKLKRRVCPWMPVSRLCFPPHKYHYHYKATVLGYCTQHLLLTIAVGKIEAMAAC